MASQEELRRGITDQIVEPKSFEPTRRQQAVTGVTEIVALPEAERSGAAPSPRCGGAESLDLCRYFSRQIQATKLFRAHATDARGTDGMGASSADRRMTWRDKFWRLPFLPLSFHVGRTPSGKQLPPYRDTRYQLHSGHASFRQRRDRRARQQLDQRPADLLGRMHAPGICVEAEHETKGVLCVDGDTKGGVFDTREVAGSDDLYVFGGFRAKNRDFIDCGKSGALPNSSFSGARETVVVAETILAQARLANA